MVQTTCLLYSKKFIALNRDAQTVLKRLLLFSTKERKGFVVGTSQVDFESFWGE